MNYKEHPTYKEHEKLGFPEFSKEDQLRIMTNFDYEQIMAKIPNWRSKPFPMGILREYFNVSRNELKEYIKSKQIVKRDLSSYSSTYDGSWIRKDGELYEFFERERGVEFNNKKGLNLDQLIDELVKKYGVYCNY